MTTSAREEIAQGKRFSFGRNWSRFLSVLNEGRIREAETSLRSMLEVDHLRDKSFLDVGSGSGLFSLAARRLGAAVVSFDYDPESVACTQELRRRYFPNDRTWQVEEGSVLDEGYVRKQGEFDVVYSWGVLHHTGDMWRALANVCLPVAGGGRLLVAIYNDQDRVSVGWRKIKELYCSNIVGKVLVSTVFIPYFVARGFAGDLLARRNPFNRYAAPSARGMSAFHDWFDWLGGLPFEVAKPEQIVRFYRDRGFTLRNLLTVGGRLGNNEFVFARE